MASIEAVRSQFLANIRHSCAVEFYVHKLGLSLLDHERPHDIVGPFNKLEEDILFGLALQYDHPDQDQPELLRAMELHRNQYHHQLWGEEAIPAFEGDYKLGAIDAICTMLEHRPYQGGPHSWNKIAIFISRQTTNPKFNWLREMLPQMMRIGKPNIESIESPFEFPNIGLPNDVYEQISRISKKSAEEYF